MIKIGIFIEGQEDLTWERFFQLADVIEDMGFESFFRSDHLTSLRGFSSRSTLALWPSLTALALRTKRIRFGPLVCSMTFRHPAMVAKMAAAVNVLSKGRFDLGLGAGWHKGEHHMFGIDFPPFAKRLEMLDEGARLISNLLSEEQTTFEGKSYCLEEAEIHPGPGYSPPAIIIGGKGEKTLAIVVKHASEWNCGHATLDSFLVKTRQLDDHCVAIGRDPASLRRSVMMPFVIGIDDTSLQHRIDAHRKIFPNYPKSLPEWTEAGYLSGSPQQLVDQIKLYEEAGVERIQLHHNDLDDFGSLELLAEKVLSNFA